MKIVGIDPGKDGAVVVLSETGEVEFKAVMPCIGKEFDILELVRILRSFSGCPELQVYIEDVHAIFNSAAGATFQFGFVAGAIRGVVTSLNMPHVLVQPKKWQKDLYQGVPEIRKPSYAIKEGKFKGQIRKGNIDTKAMSEVAAKRLFPTVDLRRSDRCKINHDGIIDALLIAEYARRQITKR